LAAPATLWGQEETPVRKRAPGFRTDLGLYFMIGGNSCAGGGTEHTECKGNGVGWSMGGGMALGLQVRPFRFFSIGIDFTTTVLSPYEDSDFDVYFKRMVDFSVGPMFTAHIPVRIKTILIEPSLGLKVGFVQGYTPLKKNAPTIYAPESVSGTYKDAYPDVEEEPPPKNPKSFKQFGPEISGVIGLNVFILPGFGFGPQVRFTGAMYQQTCEQYAEDSLCRGMHDDPEDKETESEKAPFRIFYGFYLMKYF
jgi:hypothetical protein